MLSDPMPGPAPGGEDADFREQARMLEGQVVVAVMLGKRADIWKAKVIGYLGKGGLCCSSSSAALPAIAVFRA